MHATLTWPLRSVGVDSNANTSGSALSFVSQRHGACMGSRRHAGGAGHALQQQHACMHRAMCHARPCSHQANQGAPGYVTWARPHGPPGSPCKRAAADGHLSWRRPALPLPLTYYDDAAVFPGPTLGDQYEYQYEQAHVQRLYSSLATGPFTPSTPTAAPHPSSTSPLAPPPATLPSASPLPTVPATSAVGLKEASAPSTTTTTDSPTTTDTPLVAMTATTATTNPTINPTSDNFFSRLLLTALSYSLASQLSREGQVVPLPRLCTYDDFVRVSKAIMGHGRSTKQQELLIRRALNSVIPGGSATFRLLLGKNGGKAKWAAELNARFATLMFGWLVGEMELRSTEVPDPDRPGQMRAQNSVVHLKKCRYLEASGCVSACNYLCKAPTQAFFTEEAGLPTTLNPDFKTLSCELMFGQAPPPQHEDPAFTQPCFATNCSKLQNQGLHSGHRAAVLAAASANPKH